MDLISKVANGILDYFLLLKLTQLEGIQLDVERHNNAVRNYNKYAEHLAKEFCIGIYDEMKKSVVFTFGLIFSLLFLFVHKNSLSILQAELQL
jgi:hypothetical protein